MLGVKKSQERWKQCTAIFYFYMSPALDYLYSQTYQDKNSEQSCETFARKAVGFAIEKVADDAKLNETVKADVINRLKSIKYIVAIPKEMLEPENIEEFYKELNLTTEPKFVETSLEINKFHLKIEKEPKSSMKKQLDELSVIKTIAVEYNKQNILCEFCQIQ